MNRVLLCAAFFVATAFGFCAVARALTAARSIPCADGSFRAAASRTHAKLTPCVAKLHSFILETTYYQNASRIGGTALAAYPEARVRYGVAPRWEAFVDTPSEIAKSGERGRGIYVMTQTGIGAKFDFARAGNVVYSLSAEGHPPLGALANLNLEPLSDVHVSADWPGARRRQYSLEAGIINYGTVYEQHLRASSLVAASLTQPLSPSTSATLELATQSHVYHGSRSQTSGVVSLQRLLSQRVLFNVELGTAFDATAGSKPHYLGAGFIVH